MAQMVDLSKRRIWQLHDIIKFGKFKGEDLTVAQLVKKDPRYLIWCDDNIEWFELDGEARSMAEDEALNQQQRSSQPHNPLRRRVFDNEHDEDWGPEHDEDSQIPF